MSVISGWIKTHAYRKTADGYKKESRDTSSQTVYMDSGSTLQSQLGAVTGVTTSLASTSNTTALAASAGTNLQGQIDTINSNLVFKFHGGMSNFNFNTYKGVSYAGIWLNGGTNQSGTSNAPSTADNGYLFVFVSDECQTKTIHIWVGIYKGIIQGRYYNGSSWTSWKTISSLR